ncbi:putative eka-like protein [Erysiphe necator]|uniref:Putative eka-like protein n=1 Tax=Uncinula necator TaxID=52586 RepID=A0A0B1PAI1_UNCNE|nr:putative eka-like protein [Erysiphe necator]
MTDSMDISQESPAPSTESSNQPAPIPPIPSIPNTPSNFTLPSPPLNLQPPTKTTSGGQILKPAAPFKRPVTERPSLNNSNQPNIGNAFLPKELAEIVATRQRRERAWHARLMICTTTMSNIESTLVNFKDDVEKEEVEAFKAYLRLAIANFAAVDTSPNPPKVPTHSRPTKCSNYGLRKDKNILKNVAIATPQIMKSVASTGGNTQEVHKLPKNPKINQNTWATIARNGQKKARVILSNKKQVASVSQSMIIKEKSQTTSIDKRLFARISKEHEWLKLSPAGLREVIVKKLSISQSLIGKIKPVHSGFALSPCNNEAREAILTAGNGLFMTGAKLEQATNWTPVIIPTVPTSIRKEHGKAQVSSSMLTEEVERVCSIRPTHVKLYGRNKTEAPHRTWMAYFSKSPRAGFRVFDESGIARQFKKQKLLDFCTRCNGHHPEKNCSRAPSCGNCGSTNHSEEVCMATTKCRNCGGPHRSDSRRCLVRPTRSGAPTKEQMKTYRQAGERKYQAILRSKAAEESAAPVDNLNADLANSQVSEVDVDIDNIPASCVENSTAGAMRL